jgi:hypothetical protein
MHGWMTWADVANSALLLFSGFAGGLVTLFINHILSRNKEVRTARLALVADVQDYFHSFVAVWVKALARIELIKMPGQEEKTFSEMVSDLVEGWRL